MLKVLITGVTGQDGSNMSRFLLKKFNNNIKIYGSYNSKNKLLNIEDIIDKIETINLDINNKTHIEETIKNINPDYIFNFASAQPQFTDNTLEYFTTNTVSTIFFLDTIIKFNKNIKYFSAGSSLEYVNNGQTIKINDLSEPDNIYGITKLTNKLLINYYKKKYNIFSVHAVLFNHDSSSRSDSFISIKIIKYLNQVKKILILEINTKY